MEVILAKSAGFCFGVKRAVETVYEQTGTENRIYTYGPIIHNEEVVKDLESKGVTVLEGEEDLRKLDKGTVVIRSHGVPREICEMIEKKGLTCVDATCPFVKRIHRIVEKESGEGRRVNFSASVRAAVCVSLMRSSAACSCPAKLMDGCGSESCARALIAVACNWLITPSIPCIADIFVSRIISGSKAYQ